MRLDGFSVFLKNYWCKFCQLTKITAFIKSGTPITSISADITLYHLKTFCCTKLPCVLLEYNNDSNEPIEPADPTEDAASRRHVPSPNSLETNFSLNIQQLIVQQSFKFDFPVFPFSIKKTNKLEFPIEKRESSEHPQFKQSWSLQCVLSVPLQPDTFGLNFFVHCVFICPVLFTDRTWQSRVVCKPATDSVDASSCLKATHVS